ncbi:hypothetical protein AB0O07_09265 [Streptomyces sp. NPDC093085]|uniref:hypothetical protein n=1 Tax=Streptomyces sp. NPDC093085 TaxID=3155068 RepID=UPI00341AD25B
MRSTTAPATPPGPSGPSPSPAPAAPPPARSGTLADALSLGLVLALAGAAVPLGATPAAADSNACTHHFSGPQICVRLEGNGARNSVTGIWTNPPEDVRSRAVSLLRDGRVIDTATATRSGRALTYTWPAGNTGSGTELCVRFRGSQRLACQTTR